MIPDQNLFFILGYQRSGTTWLATLLRAHPEIHCDGEGHFFQGDDQRQYLPSALAASETLRSWATAHSNLWFLDRDFDAEAEFLAAAITRAMFDRAARQTGKRFVGDKSGLAGPCAVESLARMFPGTRLLHLVRDPRDVAVSKCFHLWRGVADRALTLPPAEEALRAAYFAASSEFNAGGRSIFHPDYLSGFADEWASWVPACRERGKALFESRYLEVRYEDLHGRLDEVLSTVLAFLGAADAPSIRRQCAEAACFQKQSGRPAGEADSSSYFRRGVIGDWQTFFTPEDLERFESRCGAAMAGMGYASSLVDAQR